MPSYICDLETNGFLDKPDLKIHCAVLKDIDTGEVFTYRFPIDTAVFLQNYQDAEVIVGHNFIKFDYEVIKKVLGAVKPKEYILDTLVLGRLLFPDIKQSDFDRNRLWKEYQQNLKDIEERNGPWEEAGKPPLEFPGQMIGRHSLEAWGYRLGLHKGDYSKEMKAKGLDPWAEWNPEMHEYMVQDAEVTWELYHRFMKRNPSPQSVELEHRIAWLCAQIERNGFPFDVKKASELYGQLSDEREALRRDLTGLFPSWTVRLPDFIPKRPNKAKGYLTGVPVERFKTVEFNPSSRDHIADRLIAKYGWKPESFTENGKPIVDEEVLLALPYPEAKMLGRSFLLDKRIGQLAEGDQAWLKAAKDGVIHGSINTNGAVTGRCTHSNPNIAQVPRVGTEFGRESRALFTVPQGWRMVGADMSGLELRCLAHFMAAFDGGAYADVVTSGDVHTANQLAAGLETRNQAKTFIYGFLYGAGAEKIGKIVGKGAATGNKLKRQFLAKTPALAQLIAAVRDASKRGWLKGLDGRQIPVRSEHAALNTLLQGAGACLCKAWMCDLDDALQAKGLHHGNDYRIQAFIHDEANVAARTDEIAEVVLATAIECGRRVGDRFSFKCPLDADGRIGQTWDQVH